MSSDFIEQQARQHYSWPALETVIRDEDMDPELGARTLTAVGILAAHLGDDWPFDAWGTSHPLGELFWNRAPWIYVWLAELGEAVAGVSRLEGWEKLRSRIRDARHAPGALFELHIAARALSRELQVILEPPTHGNRRADLALFTRDNAPRRLLVEITQLGRMTREEQRAAQIMEETFPIVSLMRSDLTGGGRFLRNPGFEEGDALVREVAEFWEARKRGRDAKAVVRPGLLMMWGADRSDEQAAAHFVSIGYPGPGNFSGPPVLTDSLQRIAVRVQEKIAQLSPTEPGMIVLQPPWQLYEMSPEAICQVLESMLQRHTHINAIAIIQRKPSPDPAIHQIRTVGRDHVYVAAPQYLIYTEEVVLVRNPSRTHAAGDNVIDRLFVEPAT